MTRAAGTGDLALVVFDVDGTLVDSQGLIHAGMAAAFGTIGRAAPDLASVRAIIGLSLESAMLTLAPNLAPDEVIDLVEAYKAAFINARSNGKGEESAPLYPGVRAVLDQLYAVDPLILGVATGKMRRGLDHFLAAHDLGAYFDTLQTADFHPSKPNPAMLHQCLTQTGVDARRAVMVGDTTFDMEMGRAAGFKTVGVSWGYHDVDALIAAGADVIIDHFDALHGQLNHLIGEIA